MQMRFAILILYAIACCRAGAADSARPTSQPASAPSVVPLKFELPLRPFDIRSYRQYRVGPDPLNAEYPPDPNREPLMVPKGTVNLSKDKPVTLSAEPFVGQEKLITDGDRDCVEGTWVELAPGKQWAQVDLGNPATVYAIALWRFCGVERVYFDTIVQMSESPKFDQGVITVFNNSLTGLKDVAGKGKDRLYIETEKGKVISVNGVKGRYVRVWSNGNTTDDVSHFVEIEVYGEAEK